MSALFVKSAKHIKSHILEVEFSDGEHRVVEFSLSPFVKISAQKTHQMSGKTGTADVTATRELAWLVGFVEREGDVWFYALNMEGEQVWEQWGRSSKRIALVRSLLQELEVLPVHD
jgi:beta-lactamase class D